VSSKQVLLYLRHQHADIGSMGVDMLSACLWEQRQALEELAYQLEAELLLVAAGRHRWLARSTAAVQAALAELDAVEARRATAARRLAGELGLPPDATLNQLAQALPEAAQVLRSHRRNLRELLLQVDDLSERNRNLLARNLAATSDALALLGVSATYPSGTGVSNGTWQTSAARRGAGPVLVSTRA